VIVVLGSQIPAVLALVQQFVQLNLVGNVAATASCSSAVSKPCA
jgi:hypothetical protein